MSASITVPDGDYVPPGIVSTVAHSATVRHSLALVVAETVGGTQRLTWGNGGARQLLGYGSGEVLESVVMTTPAPSGRMWTATRRNLSRASARACVAEQRTGGHVAAWYAARGENIP